MVPACNKPLGYKFLSTKKGFPSEALFHLYSINYFEGHSPLVNSVIPWHPASQALPYVLLLQPQTGSYCIVHIQSGLTFSTHLSELLHEKSITKKNKEE